MSLGSLNYLPIFAAAIASFVFGGIWYNVFSKQWMDAVGMSPDRMQKDRSSLGLYVLAFVAQLVMAWMFAGILVHLSQGGHGDHAQDRVDLCGLPVARLRHPDHGGQLRLSRRPAVADRDRRRPLAGRPAHSGRHHGLVGRALIGVDAAQAR